MSKITKLSAKFVIGFQQGEHVLFSPGVVVYQNDRILYVGNQYAGEFDEHHSFPCSLISPGWIDLDGGIDTDHAVLDIAVPKEPEDVFIPGSKFRTVDAFQAEDYRIRTQYSIAQMIKNGITTALPITGETFYGWGQSIEECKIIAQVAIEMGMRLYIGPSFKSRAKPGAPDQPLRERNSLKDAYSFCEYAYDLNHDLIKPFINPCQISVTRLEILKEACLYAQKQKLPFRIHACEAIREWNYTIPVYGQTTIDLFESEHMLYDQFIIPHCITAKTTELALLAQRGVSVISTPFADANMGTALFSFDKYKYFGINMTMGTDSQPTDMLRNMRMAWDLDRLCAKRKFFSRYDDHGTMIPLLPEEPIYPKTVAKDYLNAATINGAKALGRDDLGRLEKGAKADIIVIKFDDVSVGPYQDAIRTMLNSCNGNHVTHTIINGHMLMKDRALIQVDEAKLIKDAQRIFDRFVSYYRDYDVEHRSIETFFPASLPTIYATNGDNQNQ